MPINNGVTNQKGTPAFYSDTFANRPAFGYAGRVFISTDSGQIFEDTGTAWTLIADAGVGGGTLSSVCLNGNTTASGIVITANGLSSNSMTNTSTTAGSILFAGTSGLQSQDNTNLFWDNTNKYLGIGPTGTPTAPLDIHSSTANVLVQLNATATNNSNLAFLNAGVGKWRIGNLYNAGANSFQIFDVLNTTARLTILNTGVTTLNGAFTSTSLAITGGTSSQFLKADGSIDSSTYLTTGTASTTYVPYTGATTNLNLGSFGITSGGIGSDGIALSQSGAISASSGRTSINGDANGIKINPVTASSNFLTFPNSGSRTYTYPNATGTIALTSDLSSYLPLAGGTLTGGLTGTSATFSGTINLTGAANTFQIAAINRNANRIFFCGDTGGFFFVNSGNTATTLFMGDNGNVLIGTTTDSGGKLQVAGEIRINSTTRLYSQNQNVSTSSTQVSAGSIGVGALYFCSWFNTTGGAQGIATVMTRGSTVVIIAISDGSGAVVTFTASSGSLFAATTSGTVNMTVAQILN